jgi:plasmid maintenance system antidote protein VapI
MSDKLAAVLRNAILKSGQSANAIAKATGVPQPTITRFLAGRDIRISKAEKIAKHLGLELRPKRPQ